jgi:hypothetical protein
MNANPARMFFCGSIPLEHEVDVFKALAEFGGQRLRRVPDGELGDRKMWVIGQYAVLAASAALEFGPFPADGLTRRTCYQIPLRLRAGKSADDIVFSGLGYARHASSSYGLFREMKKAGTLRVKPRRKCAATATFSSRWRSSIASGSARCTFGLVHYTDGVEGARRRINAAEKYLPEFGIAAECGFGRRPSHQDAMRLIKLHADIIDRAHAP